MKAAVLFNLGEAPKYADFPVPQPANDEQVIIHVKAAAVKNLDKGRASGAHYSSNHLTQPEVVGVDGAGLLDDGTRVFAFGITGMIAEQGLVSKHSLVKLPDDLDFVTAAALPNAVMGAAGALHFRAQVKAGDTVLINGATGVTGQVAVQIAKHYGAKKVIVTGRNQDSLNAVQALGADEAISLLQDDEAIVGQLKDLHHREAIDVVIDYLWGRPAELILAALSGKGGHTNRLRFVTVGGMADDKIQLSSSFLRSADIVLSGSGLGSIPKEQMEQLFKEVLPEMLQLAAAGKLKIDTVTADLKDVETAWNEHIPAGKRLVILI